HPDVLRVYDKYRDAIPIIAYPGFCNALHDVSACPELYDALRNATRFFIFLDTDEFLIAIDDDRYRDDEGLVDFLGRQNESDAHPATWLSNTDWRDTRFRCGDDFDALAGHIAWGKPILRANAALSGFINHNAQVHPSLFARPFRTNFFVLHLK